MKSWDTHILLVDIKLIESFLCRLPDVVCPDAIDIRYLYYSERIPNDSCSHLLSNFAQFTAFITTISHTPQTFPHAVTSDPFPHFLFSSEMKLLTFPTLILKEIFENLTLEQLSILAFCSKRTTFSIRAIQLFRLKNFKSIYYKITSEGEIIIRSNTPHFNISLSPRTYRDDDFVQVEVFGMKHEIDCW